jgi:hypothetical protein
VRELHVLLLIMQIFHVMVQCILQKRSGHMTSLAWGVQSGELQAKERKMERPKSHREHATMLAGLMEEATDLPPIPLTAAAARRWALEFEGETLLTYRRGGEDR